MVKNLPANAGTWVPSLDMCSIHPWEDLLEKEIATHSSILVWDIPSSDEPRGLRAWGHKIVN